jgi:hypothetical protein
MKTTRTLRTVGVLLSLLLLCGCVTADSIHPPLPADVSMNKYAGRGDLLIVTVRLENGEKVDLILDDATTPTMFDKSLEPKLGKSLGTELGQSWGVIYTNNVFAMPKLYLGNTPLITGSQTSTLDFKNQLDEDGHHVLGILGWDCLRHYCIQLDFVAHKIRFLDDEHADKKTWGKAFPIVDLNSQDARPAVAENLLGLQGPHSIIDSGCNFDGWLMPKYFHFWTNQTVPAATGEARSPEAMFDGEKYPLADVEAKNVESDGIGLRFLARHLVTMDFPKRTLYLRRQSVGPLPDPDLKTTRMEALAPMVQVVIEQDVTAARSELVKIENSNATELEKTVARKLEAILENKPKPTPADVPPGVVSLPLGDARPELAEVGWLTPAANRIPLNGQVESPLLDSGKIYATGLFAHAPSRYVYHLGGKWKTLRGEAGLHTAFQGYAYGVVFVIKTDGKEVFRSAAINRSTHPSYNLDLTGVKTLELIVEKATDQNGGNWGLWLDPTLSR